MKPFSSVLLVAALLVGATASARADAPDVLYVANSSDANTDVGDQRVELGVITGFTEAGRKVVVDHAGALPHLAAAFGPGGRFALLSSAAQIAGKTLKKHKANTITIAFGDLDAGATGVVAGDTACVSARCFETRPRFSADGAWLYTDTLTSGGTSVLRYVTGKGKLKRLFDRKKRRGVIEHPQISADGKTVAFIQGDGDLHVDKLPVARKSKPTFTGKYLIEMLRSGDRLFFKRREPVNQESYTLEMVDAAAKGQTSAQLLHTFSDGASWPAVGMRHDAVNDVLYVIDAGSNPFGQGALLAIKVADKTSRTLAKDVLRVLDVSDDGAALLIVAVADPKQLVGSDGTKSNPERLGLLDTATGKTTWLSIPKLPHIVAAAFRR